jgi:hypothetical protein
VLLWSSTILSFGGYFFINRKNSKGFVLFLVGNILTVVFDIKTENWPQFIMFSIFIFFNIDGIRRWKNETINQ